MGVKTCTVCLILKICDCGTLRVASVRGKVNQQIALGRRFVETAVDM